MHRAPEVKEARRVFDIAPAGIAKVIAAIALVWLWLLLWQLVMLVVVAIVVAIGLEPIVAWLVRHRVSRSLAATGVVAVLAVLIVGFFWITGSSLATQARELGGRISSVHERLLGQMPAVVKGALGGGEPGDNTEAARVVLNAGRLLLMVTGAVALILILATYLLIEGRRTYTWLAAYAPPARRNRVHVTASEARKAIYGYVVGNVATSLFAMGVVLIALSLLHVPAALLLALLAGIFDFVPVLGFICSAVPAVLLALGQSLGVAIAVAAVYVAYHVVENYYIAPKVYGEQLRLSNLAVILAFAAGAAIGGIGGALLALPIAALYPVVERVWLKDYLNRDAVETHQRMRRESAH